MAIITDFTKCPICDKPIGDDIENIIVFPADAIGPLSEFYLFYDGVAHNECLNTWDRKAEFVDEWNNSILSGSPVNESILLTISGDGVVLFSKQPRD